MQMAPGTGCVLPKGARVRSAAPGSRSVAELEAEVAKLRKELAAKRMAKEVLKKAAVVQ
jgi:transposase